MKLRTEMAKWSDGNMYPSVHGEREVYGMLEHDAACAHALIQEIAVLRDASESMDSTHGRLVLKLLDLLDDRAERLMREWGFDSGEVE